MTSANLSLGDRLKNRKTYINRTLWTSYVALPFIAAYFILGVIMVVSRSINYAVIYDQTKEVLNEEKIAGVARLLGFSELAWLLVIGVAIMFALQGFSYVFNTSQLDFYLSQPTTRAQRLRKNYVNAISTFMIIYMCSEILALIIAAAMGAVNRLVILAAFTETIRALNLFFAFYNITVLAVMLSGTLPIAILVTAGFCLIPIVIVGELDLFKGIFFATYSSIKPFHVLLSPLYDRISAMAQLPSRQDVYVAMSSMDGFMNNLKVILPKEIDTLVVGIIAFVAVLIFSGIRKSEWAGQSIPVRPFRWFVKILVCTIVGLGSGYFVYLVYIGVWNKRLYVMMCTMMIIATVFAGCVMEVILEGNIKRFFKGKAQTIVAACVVLMTFIIYKGDLLGYDSYVPSASKVESCAFIGGNKSFNYYNGIYTYDNNGSEMYLTDAADVVELAKEGMELQKKISDRDFKGDISGYSLTVLYRMKDGRNIYRQILVPYEKYDAQMNRIVSSEEFKRGYFDCFSDDSIRIADRSASSHNLRYISLNKSNETRNFEYDKLSDAYRKDILEHYNFYDIKDKMPIGSIEYENNSSNYIFGSFDVYEGFENTIALLKEYGIYTEGELNVDDIREIKVTNYYVGYDLDKNEDADIDYENTQSTTKSYIDKESIRKIIEVSVTNGYHNPWFNYDTTNGQYGIEVYMNGNNSYYSDLYYTFLKGKVPEFVKTDTKG